MLLQCCTSPNSCVLSSEKSLLAFSNPINKLNSNHNLGRFKHPKRASCLIKVGAEDIAEIVHNKVLIAAGVSAAIGQLSKPFTGSLLYGKQFDLMATIQAGGFPSTHSSSVVAAATCLALERGFSDSIFGLTLVYAGLVMYDAQGVRREVGIHARTLNRVIPKTRVNKSDLVSKDGDLIDGEQGTRSTLNMESLDPGLAKDATPFASKTPPLLLTSYEETNQTALAADDDTKETSEDNLVVLKESIGHTEVEVVAGALLGFSVSLAVYAIL